MKNQDKNPTGKKHTSKSEIIKTLEGESIEISSKSIHDFTEDLLEENRRLREDIRLKDLEILTMKSKPKKEESF